MMFSVIPFAEVFAVRIMAGIVERQNGDGIDEVAWYCRNHRRCPTGPDPNRLQIKCQVAHRLKPLLRILFQAMGDEPIELAG